MSAETRRILAALQSEIRNLHGRIAYLEGRLVEADKHRDKPKEAASA